MDDITIDEDSYFFIDGNKNIYPYVEDDDVNKVALESYQKWLNDDLTLEEEYEKY